MAPPPLLRLDHIALTFGGTPLLVDADLSLSPHQRIALVGRNGSGKSTLLKIAAGLSEAQSGLIFRQPGTTIRYLSQMLDFDGYDTIGDYVRAGLGPLDDVYRVEHLLAHLKVDMAAHPSQLSGGEARRAALARILAPKPDILLLDEPTNHLDLHTIEWLEEELKSIGSAQIIISHDKRFLINCSQATIWLDRGLTRRLEQGFEAFESWRDKILDEEEVERHKLSRQIAREEHWLRYGVTARRKRNVRRLSALKGLRDKQRQYIGPQGNILLEASQVKESGKLVIEAYHISKSYGENKLVDDFSLRICQGDRIGIVGPNGAGKTTLLSLITGQLKPDSGTVKIGRNLEMAMLDQHKVFAPGQTIGAFLTKGRGDSLVINGKERHVTSYMKDFLFTPEQLRTPIDKLSGGERARLLLAGLLAQPANFLIMDEPTNDLDMETLDLLKELVADFKGTVLLISHDRDFLDEVVTSTITTNGQGKWLQYAGGYSDMLAMREKYEGQKPAATAPKRAPKSVAPAAKPAKTRLSFKQKFALETLPQEMETLAAQISAFESQLSKPELYNSDRDKFNQISARLADSRALLSAKEEEWLALEILREELDER